MFLAHTMLGGKTGGQLLVLGLSYENLKRLKEGQPIFLSRKTHGLTIPPNINIVILAGETEDTMKEMMVDLIGKDTIEDRKGPQ